MDSGKDSSMPDSQYFKTYPPTMDSYQEAKTRIKTKTNEELSALFTFQGYLKCASTSKNPFSAEKKKKSVHLRQSLPAN